ncbi:MAG: hypothetical protein HZC47_02360 [Methanobacterium sp.]|uniref:hypothetical protein n=1 Tax=Methanobacterium sp. TaxID=2164 RepID=UPI003D65F35B|nr:hypothetical protein [Methanobacterium sp.]
MSVNPNEANLEAVTMTIAYLEKKGKCDENLLKELKNERDRLLKELNVHSP